ncbi:MAG: hypothetical protein LBD49_00970, partial [Oscillospiraceae bacterium]|nr:hypothetical protein [Oscillospiraceae bacterium]
MKKARISAWILALALVFSCAALLAACGDSPETTSPDTSESVPASSDVATASPEGDLDVTASEPVRDEVIIGFDSIPQSFDPLTTSGHGSYVSLFYSTLVALNSDVEVIPDLAESYTV